MHLVSYVPEALGRTFTAERARSHPALKLLGRAGVKIVGARQLVSAALAEPLAASRLGVKVGAALIDLRSLMIDSEGRAVEYVEMLAVPEHLKLRHAARLPGQPASAERRHLPSFAEEAPTS